MAVYAYKALAGPRDVTGTIAADTPRQARDLLRDQGLVVRDVVERRAASAAIVWRNPFGPRGTPRRPQVTGMLREVATLLAVGMPLLDAFDTLARQHTGRMRTAILLLRDNVAAGGSLANAMRGQPRVFDELAVHVTEVGEDSGTLDASLNRLALFREKAEQFKNRLGVALIYPAIVALVGTASSIFLMTFVVPKILQPLIEQNLPLPLPTRIVQGMSDFLLGWGWLLAIVAVAAVMAITIAARSPRVRFATQRALLRLPVIGTIAFKQQMVRIAVVLSTLLKSGVVFVRALQIARGSTGNLPIRAALEQCEHAITAGADIAEALEKTNTFPPLVVQLLALGQQSGRMEEMLDQLAAAYEAQLANDANRLAAVFEPFMIIVLALFVLFIVLATVLPILEVGNAIQ